jgi:hypothetical protein
MAKEKPEEPKGQEDKVESSEPTKASKENSLVKIRSKNFVILTEYLKKQGIDPAVFLHSNKATLSRIAEGKQNADFFAVYRLQKAFKKISYHKVRNGKEPLPENEDYGFEQRTAKIRYLDQFLVEKEQGLTLRRAVSLSEGKWKALQTGYSLPSRHLMKKIAVYFMLPPKMLLDDAEKLPAFADLKIDEDLAVIQRNDLSEQQNYYKNKHYLTRNYRVLSHSMRVKMYLSLLVIIVPLAAFTGYCAYDILQDRFSSVSKIEQTDIQDKKSKAFEEQRINDATWNAQYTYCNVKVGLQVLKIFDIKPSNEYFSAALKLWFDFDQEEFHTMFKAYNGITAADQKAEDVFKIEAFDAAKGDVHQNDNMDHFTVDRTTNEVTYASDGTPDHVELAYPFTLNRLIDRKNVGVTDPSTIRENARQVIEDNPKDTALNDVWATERSSYPGLFPSSIYTAYDPNFDVGKGIDNTSLFYDYDPGESYYLSNTSGTPEATSPYRMIQSMRFAVKVSKAYDNPRYPLETAQFWLNVTPAKWLTVDHLRYQKADVVDVSRNQISGNTGYTYCSHDEGLYTTMGDSTAFTDGFRSVKEDNGIKCHAEAIEYDINSDPSHPEKSNSKYTVVIRANRAAFTQGNFLPSTFLTTYINLFAIIIWITIAFYNQSYAGEDALGMLGTGMFSAISATIVGFQMVSDASMFSLLTMINIFTLAVILIMTYQSVMAKRANAKKDKALIAYNGVKLRVMFYVLTVCTLIIFIGLPIAAYIWTL